MEAPAPAATPTPAPGHGGGHGGAPGHRGGHGGAPRAVRHKATAFAIAVVGVVADLATKAYMQDALGMEPDLEGSRRSIEVIPGFLSFAGNWNRGVVFGLAQGWTYAILSFTVVACVAIALWLLVSRSRSGLLHVALALILAGALGNLYDRWEWHQVRDFLLVYWKDPKIWHWPTFNVADSMIVVGVSLIVGRELFGRRRPAPEASS